MNTFRTAIRNWRTSLAGVVMLAIAIYGLCRGSLSAEHAAAYISAGVGLIAARDGATANLATIIREAIEAQAIGARSQNPSSTDSK